jgi:transglutaminase-like putative cysteine protease
MSFKIFSRRTLNGLFVLLLASQMTLVASLSYGTSVASSITLPYSAVGNVTYRMEVTVNIENQHATQSCNVSLFAPQYQNWIIEVPDSLPSLQQSFMANATPYNYTSARFNQMDKYNNTIDYYDKILLNNTATIEERSFLLSMNFTLTAMQIRWDNLGTHQMTEYNTESDFYKIYTQNQSPAIDITDPAIISTAAMICGGITNPVEKARKIYNWVSKNLTYEVQTSDGLDGTGEQGASWAIANLAGDCSEFSDLMVAFLRVQGVPARKVIGLALLDPTGGQLPSYTPGATWTYYQNAEGNNLTGHAWVEYYVPGTGWVACDPTWGNSGQDYFNYIDHLHISAARGSYFGDEVNPTLISLIEKEFGEYPPLPLITSSTLGKPVFQILVHFTVLESHIWVDNTSFVVFLGVFLVIAIIAIICWVASNRRKKSVKASPVDDMF